MNRLSIVPAIMAFAFPLSVSANAQTDEKPVEFTQRVGPWVIVGDFNVGACLATGLSDKNTQLIIAIFPNRSDYAFSLSNPAWQSIINDEEMRITAKFYSSRGELTDLWNLATTGVNNDGKTPSFNFFIDRARNDRASFRSQFARASRVEFLRDSIPIARFELTASSAVLNHLDNCRDQIRLNPKFDPFAQ